MSDTDKPRAADSEDETRLARQPARARTFARGARSHPPRHRGRVARQRRALGAPPWMGYAAVASVVGVLAVAACCRWVACRTTASGEPLAQLERAEAAGSGRVARVVARIARGHRRRTACRPELRPAWRHTARLARRRQPARCGAEVEFQVMSGNAVQAGARRDVRGHTSRLARRRRVSSRSRMRVSSATSARSSPSR